LNTKLTFRGLKALLLSRRPNIGAAHIAALRARALFQPPDTAVTERRRNLVEFLGQVSLFEDLDRRELGHFARIVHSVPEPATWLLLSLGMISVVSWRRLRQS
jgi:hypothetical protein